MNRCKNIDAERNTIITCSHPSPLAAYKTDQPFIGSRYVDHIVGVFQYVFVDKSIFTFVQVFFPL